MVRFIGDYVAWVVFGAAVVVGFVATSAMVVVPTGSVPLSMVVNVIVGPAVFRAAFLTGRVVAGVFENVAEFIGEEE